MIIIAHTPLSPLSLSDTYDTGSIETRLLEQMSDSTTHDYTYESLDTLKFELQLRKEIVYAATALHNSGMSFAIFHQSRCNPIYWERTQAGGFQLKPGSLPSDAISNIYVEGHYYATECATAMMMVCYRALLSVFGVKAFNAVFHHIHLMNWHIRETLLDEFGQPDPVTDFLCGDRGYFMNPDVDPVTPQWQGENVIVMPDERYYGHGVGIANAQNIVNSLNAYRKKDAVRSAFLMDSVSRLSFKKLARMYHQHASQPEL